MTGKLQRWCSSNMRFLRSPVMSDSRWPLHLPCDILSLSTVVVWGVWIRFLVTFWRANMKRRSNGSCFLRIVRTPFLIGTDFLNWNATSGQHVDNHNFLKHRLRPTCGSEPWIQTCPLLVIQQLKLNKLGGWTGQERIFFIYCAFRCFFFARWTEVYLTKVQRDAERGLIKEVQVVRHVR
jgi:hypothetical protein